MFRRLPRKSKHFGSHNIWDDDYDDDYDEDYDEDSGGIETLDELVEDYVANYPEYASRLRDPRIVSYISNYYSYMDWRDNGNTASYSEDNGYMLALVRDLTEEPSKTVTDYITGYGDMQYALAHGIDVKDWKDAQELLAKRADIQRAYGVTPVVISMSRKPGNKARR